MSKSEPRGETGFPHTNVAGVKPERVRDKRVTGLRRQSHGLSADYRGAMAARNVQRRAVFRGSRSPGDKNREKAKIIIVPVQSHGIIRAGSRKRAKRVHAVKMGVEPAVSVGDLFNCCDVDRFRLLKKAKRIFLPETDISKWRRRSRRAVIAPVLFYWNSVALSENLRGEMLAGTEKLMRLGNRRRILRTW